MAYQVFDNGRPADTTICGAGSKMTKGIGWDISRFDTKQEAYDYAYDWLGKQYKPDCSLRAAIQIELFKAPWVYSGAGDNIQVKEIA